MIASSDEIQKKYNLKLTARYVSLAIFQKTKRYHSHKMRNFYHDFAYEESCSLYKHAFNRINTQIKIVRNIF